MNKSTAPGFGSVDGRLCANFRKLPGVVLLQ